MQIVTTRAALVLVLALGFGASRLSAGDTSAEAPREWTRAFHRGEYERAAALARERLKAQPRDVEARIVLGRAEAARQHFTEAYEEFRRALRFEPGNPDALYYLGITAGVLAQLEYERLFALAPSSSRAHQLRAETLEAQERTPEAEAAYREALRADPRSVEVLVAIGDLTRRDAAYEEALGYYERAAALAPRNYDVLYGMGVCRAFRQEHEKAIGLFRKALRLEPESAPARLALGSSLFQTGRPAEAITELKAAAAREPRMRQAHYLLGRAYAALGRSREAEAAFSRVRELVRQEMSPGEGEGPASPEVP